MPLAADDDLALADSGVKERPCVGQRGTCPGRTSLTRRGRARLICRLIVVLPQATATGAHQLARRSGQQPTPAAIPAGLPVVLMWGKRPLSDATAQRGATWRHTGHSVGKTMSLSHVPHLTGLDVPRWRPGTTITDGRIDARLRG